VSAPGGRLGALHGGEGLHHELHLLTEAKVSIKIFYIQKLKILQIIEILIKLLWSRMVNGKNINLVPKHLARHRGSGTGGNKILSRFSNLRAFKSFCSSVSHR
jgi:hypothetical protein